MRSCSPIAVCLVIVAAFLAPSAAAGDGPVTPTGFRLQATNGYSLRALSYDGDPKGDQDALLLWFSGKDSAVSYAARKGVEVTETTISADLGSIGTVDIHFVPHGPPREEVICGSEPIEFQPGFFEGRIDIEGEEGFTEVHAMRAPGEIRFVLRLVFCSRDFSEGAGGRSPGARLSVSRHWSQGSLHFEARKNSPTRPARFSASITERRGNLAISRGVASTAGPGAFEFDVPQQRAVLDPPSPFKGTARFRGSAGRGPGRLRGSLGVDFPGHSNVSLAGSRGGLGRYVQNPGQVFRPQSRPNLFQSRAEDEKQHVKGGESEAHVDFVPWWGTKATRSIPESRGSLRDSTGLRRCVSSKKRD
jgi:hypothetical protein